MDCGTCSSVVVVAGTASLSCAAVSVATNCRVAARSGLVVRVAKCDVIIVADCCVGCTSVGNCVV